MKDVDTKKINFLISEVKKYKEIPQDYNGINELIEIRKNISTVVFSLSISLGKIRRNLKDSELTLENKKVREKLAEINKGTKAITYNVQISVKFEQETKTVQNLESDFYEVEYMIRYVKEVLSELNQRISILKSELKQDTFFNSQA